MLGETGMVGSKVFHPNVEQGCGIAGSETLSGSETGQGLIGFFHGGKGTSKGHPCRDDLRIESGGPTKVSLGDMIASTGIVVGTDGKPGRG